MALARRIASSYDHQQTAPSMTWTIVHGLGDYPIVDAFTMSDGVLQRILPANVQYIDKDTVVLLFSTSRSGFATVV